jgi:hypothetical protein
MLEFIHRLVSLRRALVLYGRGNVMFTENLQSWRTAAAPFFKERGAVEITTAGNKLFFGDTLIGRGSPFVRELVENLRRLIIRRLSIYREIDDGELCTLMDMLSHESRALLVKGGPVVFLREQGVQHVGVIENVYLKRVGEEGEIPLEEAGLNLDDLNFIKGQLKNMIALAREGFELRGEERGLLAEVAQQPTFMGELLREMTGEGKGEAAPDLRTQGEEMSEVLEVLVTELRKGGRLDDDFFREAFSGALSAIEEPLRLEVLRSQCATAGQLPPLLRDAVFDCSRESVRDFILGLFARDREELWRAQSLLKHLAPDREVYDRLDGPLAEGCRERGLDREKLKIALRGVLEPLLMRKPPLTAAAAEELAEMRAQMRKLAGVKTDTAAVGAYLGGGDVAGEELIILSGLLGGGGLSVKLADRAASRIRGLCEKGAAERAWPLLRVLLTYMGSGDSALAGEIGKEIGELCRQGVARALLSSPMPAEAKTELLTDMVKALSPEDAAALWEELASGDIQDAGDLLAEVGKREAKAVATLLRVLSTKGRADLVARSVDVLAALPPAMATPLLLDFCRHTEPKVRLRAVSLLGRAGIAEAIPFLLVMVGDRDCEVRRTAIPILGHLGGAQAAEKLLEIAGDARGVWDVEERVLACRGLAKCGGERAVPALARLLADIRESGREEELRSLRGSARFALESIGGEQARQALDGDARRSTSLFQRLFKRR